MTLVIGRLLLLIQRIREFHCELTTGHQWLYDEEETNSGPWTGYIETCANCGALQQIPQ